MALRVISSKFPIGVAMTYSVPVLLSLVNMFIPKKNLIILITLLCLSSCASNFNKSLDPSDQVISIEKPSLKFKPYNFPKDINIILISKIEKKNRNSLEGIISNYYFYKNNLGYSPRLKILELLKTNQSNRCLEEKIKGFSIILMLDIKKGDFPDYCLKEISSKVGKNMGGGGNAMILSLKTEISLNLLGMEAI